jgi:hypothetical protein
MRRSHRVALTSSIPVSPRQRQYFINNNINNTPVQPSSSSSINTVNAYKQCINENRRKYQPLIIILRTYASSSSTHQRNAAQPALQRHGQNIINNAATHISRYCQYRQQRRQQLIPQ